MTNTIKCEECDEEFCTKTQLKAHSTEYHKVINDVIYIYRITCPKGKCYVGRTVDLEKRIKQHKSMRSSPLHQVFKEFKEKVSIDILEKIKIDKVPEDQLFQLANQKEMEYILKYDSVNNGYNTIYT